MQDMKAGDVKAGYLFEYGLPGQHTADEVRDVFYVISDSTGLKVSIALKNMLYPFVIPADRMVRATPR